MIKKLILFAAMFASCAINASTLPQPKIKVTTNLAEFNDNAKYIKEHETEEEAKTEIDKFLLEKYGQKINLENKKVNKYEKDLTQFFYQ